MANRFTNPRDQFLDATPNPYAGGKLYFYLTTTTTPANTYSDTALTIINANPVILDSAGRIPGDLFLDPAVTYKIVFKDANDVTIWTADPVVDAAANVIAAFRVYAGNPNGFVAGNQGSVGGSGASVVWDIINRLLYVCTTTGTAVTAVWTQVASSFGGAVQFSGIITPASLAVNQNDYNPTGLSTASILRQTASADVTITGLAGGATGRVLIFQNVSTQKITLANESTSSTAANRFTFDGDLVLLPDQSVHLWYDVATSRWRQIGAFGIIPSAVPGGRLTLTSGTPVLAADTSAQTTVYYTPYIHNYIRFFNGSKWNQYQFSELSQALSDATKSPAAAATNSLYDLFVWNDTGTIRCTRGPAWSSATSRGSGAGTTELERVDGVLVNRHDITNGPLARRGVYVGTIATDGSTQLNMEFEPAAAGGGTDNRLDIWNMYNRVDVCAICRDANNSWTYSTETWRSANNSTSNRITFVCGQIEDGISADAMLSAYSSTGGSEMRTGIGVDSTSTPSGFIGSVVPGVLGDAETSTASYNGRPGLGRRFLQMLEWAEAIGTTTFYGDAGSGGVLLQSGISMTFRM